MKNCSRYVAVVLDQNLAMNLDRRSPLASTIARKWLSRKMGSHYCCARRA